MSQTNRLLKLTTIVLALSTLFTGSLFAQSDKNAEKSTIVMTKSELDSFLSTIAEARRSELKARDSRSVKQDLEALRLKYQQRNAVQSYEYAPVSNEQILRELRYINQRIDNLSGNNSEFPSMNRDNSTVVVPGNAAGSSLYAPNDRNATTLITSDKKRIKELEATIDSLRNVTAPAKVYKEKNSFGDSLSVINSRLDIVRRHLDSLEMKMKPVPKTSVKAASPENKSYFKQQVYFDNNSQTLHDEYFKYIQDLTQILLKYPEAKVMLEGWASPVGKPLHNKQLSMRRAESVEKAFLNNGIASTRILTSFRGEDKSSSEQHARRVDMSIIVR
ncbi:OmpA family protein [Flavobacterium ardleyense]|uniref:OmpA family protein n=1 Tax=Flavobacterium ardleyense TaxID=2038737 RepID=A0ABW5Z404_9FLAO